MKTSKNSLDFMAAAVPPSLTKVSYDYAKTATTEAGAVYRLRDEGTVKSNCWAHVLAEQNGNVIYQLWPKIGPAQSMDAKAFKFMYVQELNQEQIGKVLSGLFNVA